MKKQNINSEKDIGLKKAEDEGLSKFDIEARNIVKRLLLEENINFIELTDRLAQKGYVYTAGAIRLKVGRGRYDVRFLLQVADALGKRVSVG